MTTTAITTMRGYQAALDSAAYYIHPDSGYLRLTGKDRVDFLQRQTTNDMGLLKEGWVLQNVLTTPFARILDVFQLISAPDAIGIITLAGNAQATATFLKRKIFFMDQVKVEDASAETAIIDIEGPKAQNVLARIGIEKELEVDQVNSISVGETRMRMIAQKGLTSDIGYRLVLPLESLGLLLPILEDATASSLDEDSYETLRIEAGQPKRGHELIEDYTPLEINLHAAISDNKGCYTGQEVIARQITYDKITKRLVQLQMDAAVELGANVLAEGKKIGVVTSAVVSPRLGPLALTVLKRPNEKDGSQVTVEDGEGVTEGTVKSLVELNKISPRR